MYQELEKWFIGFPVNSKVFSKEGIRVMEKKLRFRGVHCSYP